MKKRSEAVGSEDRDRKKKKAEQDSIKIPLDTVNEVVLIAAAIVLLGRDREAASKLLRVPADSFYGKGHADAWGALQETLRLGLTYDPATISQISNGLVNVEEIDNYVALRPEPPPNLQHHVERMKWDRARVELVKGPLLAFHEALKDPGADPAKVCALARNVAGALDHFGDKRYLRDPQQLVHEHSRELTERRTGRAVYPYGIDAVDNYGKDDTRESKRRGETVYESLAGEPRCVPGARPGDITVLVGNSGHGKTTTAARIILAQQAMGRRVLYGAWEQGSGMTLELLAAMNLDWSRTDAMIGRYTADDQRLLEEEMDRIGSLVRFFELPFGRQRGKRSSNEENLDLISEHIADSGCDVFVADLFHQTIVDHEYGKESDALYGMHAITEEHRCHSILVHQLRLKDAEAREEQRPTRELLKGNAAWVEVGDTIIGTFIPGLTRQIPRDRIEYHILKQRYGVWPQAIECEYDAEYGYVGAGKTIPVHQSNESSDDGLLGASLTRSRFGSKKRK